MAELLQDYWQKVGIKTNLNYGLSEIIYTRRLNGEFEVLAWKFNAPADPLKRAAGLADGAFSILTGVAANRSMATDRPVRADQLVTGLPTPDHPEMRG